MSLELSAMSYCVSDLWSSVICLCHLEPSRTTLWIQLDFADDITYVEYKSV
jgi:hypothetical protein